MRVRVVGIALEIKGANNYSNSSYTIKVIMNIYIINICLNMQM